MSFVHNGNQVDFTKTGIHFVLRFTSFNTIDIFFKLHLEKVRLSALLPTADIMFGGLVWPQDESSSCIAPKL